MITDEHNEQIFEQVRAILSEHFPNFMFAAMDDDGELYYDFTNLPIGRMLQREMQEDMENEALEDDWIIDWSTEDKDDEWNQVYSFA